MGLLLRYILPQEEPSYISISLFRENNVVVFPIPFHIFMPLANLWLIRLRGQFPILRTSFPDLYPLIRPPKRPLVRILFSNTLSLHSSLNVGDNISQPYSTTGNIIVLYILNVLITNEIMNTNLEFCNGGQPGSLSPRKSGEQGPHIDEDKSGKQYRQEGSSAELRSWSNNRPAPGRSIATHCWTVRSLVALCGKEREL